MIALPVDFNLSLFISDLMPLMISIVEVCLVFFSLRLVLRLGKYIKQVW